MLSLDLAELSDRAGVSARTVRYYIQQGLLPAPESRGPGARYGAEHLDRLRLIRRLQREHLPLAEIRRRLEELDPLEIRQLSEEAAERPPSSATDYIRGLLSEGPATLALSALAEPAREAAVGMVPAPPPTRDRKREAHRAARSQWDRIALAPDVELHVRRPLTREQNRQVERLVEAARTIFEEELP